MSQVTKLNRIASLGRIGFKRGAGKVINAEEQGLWTKMVGPVYFLGEKSGYDTLLQRLKVKDEIIFELERKVISFQRIAQEQADEHFVLIRYMTERGNMQNYKRWYVANAKGILAKEHKRRASLQNPNQSQLGSMKGIRVKHEG